MPQSLSELEQQRSLPASQLSQLGDLRPGSVTGIVRRCGKPTSMPSDRKSRAVGNCRALSSLAYGRRATWI
jgi:hypothetical protein